MEHPNLPVNRARKAEKIAPNARSVARMFTNPTQPAGAKFANPSSSFSPSSNERGSTITSRRKLVFRGLHRKQSPSLLASYPLVNLHNMSSPPTSPSQARQVASPGTTSQSSKDNSAAPGYYLSDLLYRGRSNDEIFYFETHDQLRAKHNSKIRDTKQSLREAERILENPENFRHLQQLLRDRHCVTDALLRENIHQFLKDSQQSSTDFQRRSLSAVESLVDGRDESTAFRPNRDVSKRL